MLNTNLLTSIGKRWQIIYRVHCEFANERYIASFRDFSGNDLLPETKNLYSK